MKIKFLIKDIGANTYYWAYHLGTGFSQDVEEATRFDSRDEAVKRIEEEISVSTEIKRELQIIDVYVVGE